MTTAQRVEPRHAARRLTTGVTVLTTGSGATAHGTTASCVASVAQEPPTVSVGLRHGSYFATLAAEYGVFAINVLTSRQALLAEWFADPQRPRGAAQFAPIRRRLDPDTGLILLLDCLAVLVCAPRRMVPAGEYDLLIAEVLEAHEQPGTPLLNYGGALHRADLEELPRLRGRRPVRAAAISVD